MFDLLLYIYFLCNLNSADCFYKSVESVLTSWSLSRCTDRVCWWELRCSFFLWYRMPSPSFSWNSAPGPWCTSPPESDRGDNWSTSTFVRTVYVLIHYLKVCELPRVVVRLSTLTWERLPEVHLDQLPVWPVADVAKNTANTHHRYKNRHIVWGYIPSHVGMQLYTPNLMTRQ